MQGCRVIDLRKGNKHFQEEVWMQGCRVTDFEEEKKKSLKCKFTKLHVFGT